MTERRVAVYRHFDANGGLLYVGQSRDPLKRLRQHQTYADWFYSIATVTIEWHDDLDAALAAETIAIKAEKPLFNTILNTHSKRAPAAPEMNDSNLAEDPLPDDVGPMRYTTDRLPMTVALILRDDERGREFAESYRVPRTHVWVGNVAGFLVNSLGADDCLAIGPGVSIDVDILNIADERGIKIAGADHD